MGNIYYLDCPYKEKDIVSELGALWDKNKRLWFFTEKSYYGKLKSWLPSAHLMRAPILAEDLSNIGVTSEYVVFSFESTSISENAELIELSIVSLDGRELYYSLFYPRNDIIHCVATRTGLTKQKLNKQPFFYKEWPEIKNVLKDKKVVVYNKDIARRLLRQTLTIHNLSETDADDIFNNAISIIDLLENLSKKEKPQMLGLEYVVRDFKIITPEERILQRTPEQSLLMIKILQNLAEKEHNNGKI